jgi:hypothetical protein
MKIGHFFVHFYILQKSFENKIKKTRCDDKAHNTKKIISKTLRQIFLKIDSIEFVQL